MVYREKTRGITIDFYCEVNDMDNMNNPFRNKLWQQTIKKENKLYPNKFCMSMTDTNGTFVRLSEINEMIRDGILKVDFDKLEQRIFDKIVVKYG